MKTSHFSSNYDFSGRPIIQGGTKQTNLIQNKNYQNLGGDHYNDNDVSITSTYVNTNNTNLQTDYDLTQHNSVNNSNNNNNTINNSSSSSQQQQQTTAATTTTAAANSYGNLDQVKYEAVNSQSDINNEYHVIRSTNKYQHKGAKRKRETGGLK